MPPKAVMASKILEGFVKIKIDFAFSVVKK